MGIIKAALTSTRDVFSEQWKEYFYCDAMPQGVIGMRARKRISENSSNRDPEDNVITDGSVVCVNEGQTALAVEQGKAFAYWDRPGEYEFHSELSGSVFEKDGLKNVFHQIGNRISFGGDVPLTQRIYYFTTLESGSVKFDTPQAMPFRIRDDKKGIHAEIRILCTGSFTYRLRDPLLFYNRVCGNFSETYTAKRLNSQLRSEFLSTVYQAVAEKSEQGLTLSGLNAAIPQLCERIRSLWKEDRGLELVSLALNLSAEGEDLQAIQNIQLFSDPSAMAAHLGSSMAESLRLAASSANRSAGVILAGSGQTGLQQQLEKKNRSWKCICGTVNQGQFCTECGRKCPHGSRDT